MPKTSEEIKKGLEIAINGCMTCDCCITDCPYDLECHPMNEDTNVDMPKQVAADALACIQQLEYHLREATKMVPKWISVEAPPKKGGRYLILFEDGHCCDAEFDEDIDFDSQFGEWVSIYHPETLGYLDSKWRGYQEVTHWMPLPEPPKEDLEVQQNA